jgi:hypothetical protein
LLHDCVTESTSIGSAIPADTSARCDGVRAIDLACASGAGNGFAGLIANRGRPGSRESVSPSSPRTRKLVALPGTDAPKLHVGVAESLEQIEATDCLVSKRYAWRGYRIEQMGHPSLPEVRERAKRKITFFAADPPTTLGTVTLRLDRPEGLLAEATHRKAVQRARVDGRRVGELTRLALAEDVDSQRVLASLFGIVYAVGRVIYGVTNVFIEVNPRHVAFYVRALGFVVAGEARFCERVRAPSVLLHLAVETLEALLGLPGVAPGRGTVRRYGT